MTLHSLTSKIRDHINDPIVQHELLQDEELWCCICSSLDAIEDTDMVIEAYLKKEPSKDWPMQLLHIYGVLQAMFVQQDAVQHLCEGLAIDLGKENSDLQRIRDLRNLSIGHPTKKRIKKKRHISYFMIQTSISDSGFEGFSTAPQSSVERVNVPDLCTCQRSCHTEILAKVLKIMQKRKVEHAVQFASTPLTEVFPATTGYYMEKIVEGCHGKDRQFARINLKLITDTLDALEGRLKERGFTLGAFPCLEHLFHRARHVATRLDQYFSYSYNELGGRLVEDDAYEFALTLRSVIDDIRQAVKEIDADYEQVAKGA